MFIIRSQTSFTHYNHAKLIQMDHLPLEHCWWPCQWEMRSEESCLDNEMFSSHFIGQDYVTPTQQHGGQEVQYYHMPKTLTYLANHIYIYAGCHSGLMWWYGTQIASSKRSSRVFTLASICAPFWDLLWLTSGRFQMVSIRKVKYFHSLFKEYHFHMWTFHVEKTVSWRLIALGFQRQSLLCEFLLIIIDLDSIHIPREAIGDPGSKRR